jgi:aldehyde dehydrogenase (NAD+)
MTSNMGSGALSSRAIGRRVSRVRADAPRRGGHNGCKLTIQIPYGGYKQSGYGRCQSRFGYEELLQIKSIQRFKRLC